MGPFINTLGLLFDILGAWLVAWEVVKQYRGRRFNAGGRDEDPAWGPAPVRETKSFETWERGKLARMKWGLAFLTVGFVLQIVSVWLPKMGWEENGNSHRRFFGALIGAMGPVLVVLIQTRSQERQARVRAAFDAAVHDHNTFREILRDLKRAGDLFPLSTYIYYYQRILEIMEKGKLAAEDIKKLDKEQRELEKAIREAQTGR